MGINTGLIVLNDALNHIKDDRDFGKKLASASITCHAFGKHVDIPSGGYVNAATVFCSHHADYHGLYLIGGNTGIHTGAAVYCNKYVEQDVLILDALKDYADLLGYRLVKKSKK